MEGIIFLSKGESESDIELFSDIQEDGRAAEDIVKSFFDNNDSHSTMLLRMRVWWNVCVKLVYVFISVLAVYCTDG